MNKEANGITNGAPFTIHHQYVKDLSFENLRPFGEEQDSQPEISVKIGLGSDTIAENIFELLLKVEVTAQYDNDEEIFLLELTYGAVVELDDTVEESKKQKILMIDVAYYLFPYIRNVVSDSTQQGGFPPFYLNPIDFTELYQQQ